MDNLDINEDWLDLYDSLNISSHQLQDDILYFYHELCYLKFNLPDKCEYHSELPDEEYIVMKWNGIKIIFSFEWYCGLLIIVNLDSRKIVCKNVKEVIGHIIMDHKINYVV